MEKLMKAFVFYGVGNARLEEIPVPKPDYGEAVLKVNLTTICTTDIHILEGDFPVKPGIVIGHEFVGEIKELGHGVEGYEVGERVAVCADTPCGQCFECLGNVNGRGCHAHGSLSAFHLGALRNGAHAEYVAVPFAQANMAKIPDELSDEQVLFVGDVVSTGFSASETAGMRIGDTVVIFGQGPIGLAATVGAKLNGAGFIITVDTLPMRMEMSRKMGADVVVDASKVDAIAEIEKLTEGRMADVSIEVVGKPATFLNALKAIRAGGVLSSIGNYGFKGSLPLPLDAFLAGVGDKKIFTTTSPGGKDRARRLLNMIQHGKFDLTTLITHRFSLDQVEKAYEVFQGDKNKVLKVAIKP